MKNIENTIEHLHIFIAWVFVWSPCDGCVEMFNHQLHLTWPFRQTLEKLLKYTYYQMKFLLGNVGFCCCCICYVKYNKKGYQGRFTFEVFLFVEKADKLRVLYFLDIFSNLKCPMGNSRCLMGVTKMCAEK